MKEEHMSVFLFLTFSAAANSKRCEFKKSFYGKETNWKYNRRVWKSSPENREGKVKPAFAEAT